MSAMLEHTEDCIWRTTNNISHSLQLGNGKKCECDCHE